MEQGMQKQNLEVEKEEVGRDNICNTIQPIHAGHERGYVSTLVSLYPGVYVTSVSEVEISRSYIKKEKG